MAPIYPIKLYLRHFPNAVLITLSFILQTVIWVWLLWNIHSGPEPIFLHYNVLFGVDYIGEWWRVLTLPLVGLGILLSNALVGWLCFHRDKFVAYLMNTVALLCQILLLVAAVLLVFLNV